MPNPPIRYWEPLSSLKNDEVLEFECGWCGRTALVTPLQLLHFKVTLQTPIEQIRQKSRCKRCARPHPKNRVRVRKGRD